MARRDLHWLLGAGALVVWGAAHSKRGGTFATPSGPAIEGLKAGDVISYVTNPDGTILVSTPQGDADFGVPRIAPKWMGLFRDMVSKWQPQVDALGTELRVPSATIFGIMWSESAGNAGKTNTNTNGSIDAGLMMINQVNWGGRSLADVMVPATNLRLGVTMLRDAAQGFRDLPQVASIYNAGKKPDGSPHLNAENARLATRWGYLSHPGYIDSVVAASNTYLSDYEKRVS